MPDNSEDKTYKLGATAPTLETIRDFLRSDVDDIREEIAGVKYTIERVTEAVSRLSSAVDQMEEVALDLLDDILKGNADITVARVEDDGPDQSSAA